MRLTKIKIAGFKTFVDPTVIPIQSNLAAIVGPNGCGKSNVIDAVRWVMGESSAKNLRGGQLSDVIFNGSTSRKPLGQATVELHFDNSNNRLGGEYAQYSEIAIRRQVTRDSQSNYFLNGTRCRRRDITDIFMGTGLGPRSYAIIEQGMISRVIESKPEELRIFIEEAAGISKYKERRKETETRIQHARDNLARLMDLREELDKQLKHLHTQAESAAKFKVLKQTERTLDTELKTLQWQRFDNQLQTKAQAISQLTVALEGIQTQYQQQQTQLEAQRTQLHAAQTKHSTVQEHFYALGSEIARLEQRVTHHRQRRTQLKTESQQLQSSIEEQAHQFNQDQQRVTHLTSALAELAPEYTLVAAQAQEMAQSQLEAEQQLEAWRAQWETVQNEASRASQSAEVEKTKISGLERQVHQAEPRQQRLQSEYQTLTAEAKAISWQHLDTELQYLTQTLAEKDRVITQQQQAKKDTLAQRDNIRQQLMHQQATVQEQQTQLASLQAVQDAALGKQSTENNAWLTRNGLAEHQRLAEVIIVDKPWQLAVETVLGDTLEAIILTAQDTPLATLPDALMTLDNGNLSFFEPCEAADLTEKLPGLNQLNVLLDYVSFKSESAIPGLGLHQIYAVDTLAQAMSLRFELDAMGSMITQSGIWLGRNWLRVKKGKAEDHSGILERDQTIKALTQSLASNSAELESLQGHYQQIEATIEDLVIQLESAQAEKNQLTQQLSELTAQLGAKKDRLHRLEQRQDQIQQELHELNDQCQTWQAEINASRQQLDQALEKMNATNQSRQDLTTAKAAIVQQLEQTRAQATSYQQTEHNLALKRQKMQSEQDSTTENMYRLERQQQVLTDRLALTMQDIQDNELPIADLEKQWAQLLEQRLDLEGSLTTAKEALSEIESSIHVLNQQCLDLARQLEQQREQLQKHKMEWQALSIHRQNIEAQFNEPNSDFAALVQALPQEATEQKWSNRLKQLAQQIQSLGAINLAAIEEYQSQLQRKQYLDTQDQDLQQALSILETAINKIDQETRARFKETFNSINQNFKGLFPRLFGGGEAKLVLTGDELLDAGINVIAKPPGKKNSSIHLLSGGEKALTAVALVFAIFELNPAPFCILDEVDAPLDDSNVRRFCHLVKSMSQNVQFIYISHNKLAMEMAEQLQGVTMKEPGVSRIVTVDMEQATTMAQA